MDDVRTQVLDEIDALLGRLSRSVRIDFEAAEAWMAWWAMAQAVRSGAIEGTALEVLGARVRRVAGIATAA